MPPWGALGQQEECVSDSLGAPEHGPSHHHLISSSPTPTLHPQQRPLCWACGSARGHGLLSPHSSGTRGNERALGAGSGWGSISGEDGGGDQKPCPGWVWWCSVTASAVFSWKLSHTPRWPCGRGRGSASLTCEGFLPCHTSHLLLSSFTWR